MDGKKDKFKAHLAGAQRTNLELMSLITPSPMWTLCNRSTWIPRGPRSAATGGAMGRTRRPGQNPTEQGREQGMGMKRMLHASPSNPDLCASTVA